jgi:hypothetical protein
MVHDGSDDSKTKYAKKRGPLDAFLQRAASLLPRSGSSLPVTMRCAPLHSSFLTSSRQTLRLFGTLLWNDARRSFSELGGTVLGLKCPAGSFCGHAQGFRGERPALATAAETWLEHSYHRHHIRAHPPLRAVNVLCSSPANGPNSFTGRRQLQQRRSAALAQLRNVTISHRHQPACSKGLGRCAPAG